jgi:hypothetical protein
MDKFSRVFWHHTCRFQTHELDPDDPVWKRSGGELADLSPEELLMLENASLTASAVESCQGEGAVRVRPARVAVCHPSPTHMRAPVVRPLCR